jgi:monoamine oxidase
MSSRTRRPPKQSSTRRLRRIAPPTVIVGAGIAGLTIAERLIAAGTPAADILFLEKYDYAGGRIVSHRDGYEIGAGRIHTSHRYINALIDRFDLTRIPLGTEAQWWPLGSPEPESEPNRFEVALRPLLRRFRPADLRTHTIRQLLSRILSPAELTRFLNYFPYRAETEVLRADLAVQSFQPRGEMGSRQNFFVVREGLSAITRAMRASLQEAGVRFQFNAEVIRVEVDGTLHLRNRIRPMHPARTILALHAEALQRILPPVAARPFRSLLRMEPLTRIYAAYPPEHPWTRALFAAPPIVTDSPLRYIIPVNPAAGIVMISYTEGRDTRHWHSLKGARLQAALQREIERLWSSDTATSLPDPLWVRPYEWTAGCTYWRPGDYDPRRVARVLQHPFPTVWIAGESLSVGRQAWIEGSLEVAHAVADRIVA